MGSKSSSPKKNIEPTKFIFFDPETDQSNKDQYFIRENDLLPKLNLMSDINEEIVKISIYKNPINSIQLTNYIIYHAFVVFQTKNYCWSIEKETEGLTIQRSLLSKNVIYKYRHKERTSNILNKVSLIIQAKGKGKVKDLIDLIYSKDLLFKEYSIKEGNCKNFAEIIFNSCNSEGKIY
jgi:hypothetical protein